MNRAQWGANQSSPWHKVSDYLVLNLGSVLCWMLGFTNTLSPSDNSLYIVTYYYCYSQYFEFLTYITNLIQNTACNICFT